MAFQSQSQFKTTSVRMCRNGAREDCPVDRCRFQHSMPPHVLYSSALNGSVPPPPSPVTTSPTRTHFPSTERGARGWRGEQQHVTPSGTFDANALAQATDGLAIYRAWLESQVEVQKAKIQAMSKQYALPIPQLNLDPLDFPPLGMVPANMANNTLPASATNNFRGQRPEVPSTPQAPRLEPVQLQNAKNAPVITNRYHHHEGPTPYAPENPDSAKTAAPRKIDISYKTTPCRHFTLNRGWCPWGDDCCFIHDPALDWAPPPDRGTSGRSTPSSTTLVGAGANCFSKPVLNNTGTAPEPNTAPRSSSSQSAHCWGYIQGLCPHPDDTCKYMHPSNILPYIKYTPCLTWPRCGYPIQTCPLKHPQVDKLPTQAAQSTIVAQPQPQTAQYDAAPTPSLIIPHDAAYASAVQYHNPSPPSAETFSPPPQHVAVRVSHPRPSSVEDAGRVLAADQVAAFGVHQGRGRRVSIAVQGMHAELAGGASGYGKEYARAHGRGKSMQF